MIRKKKVGSFLSALTILSSALPSTFKTQAMGMAVTSSIFSFIQGAGGLILASFKGYKIIDEGAEVKNDDLIITAASVILGLSGIMNGINNIVSIKNDKKEKKYHFNCTICKNEWEKVITCSPRDVHGCPRCGWWFESLKDNGNWEKECVKYSEI